MTIEPGTYDPEFHDSCDRCDDTGQKGMLYHLPAGPSICERCLTPRERRIMGVAVKGTKS